MSAKTKEADSRNYLDAATNLILDYLDKYQYSIAAATSFLHLLFLDQRICKECCEFVLSGKLTHHVKICGYTAKSLQKQFGLADFECYLALVHLLREPVETIESLESLPQTL